MTRRVVLGAILIALVLAAAVAPWTISSERLDGGIARQMAPYGFRLSAMGRTSVALLPVPRIRISKVTIADGEGSAVLQDAQLRGDLDIRALLMGRVALGEASLSGGRLALAVEHGEDTAWWRSVRRVRAEMAAGGAAGRSLRRLTVSGLEIDLRDARTGLATSLTGVELFVLRPASGGLAASLTAGWRGEAIEAALDSANLGRFLAGEAQDFRLRVTSRLAKLSMTGTASLGDRVGFAGPITAEIGSLSRFLTWVAPRSTPSAALDRRVALSGAATLDGRDIAWPKVGLELGSDALDGTVSARLDADRPALRATLAAGALDLGWLSGPIQPFLAGWTEGRASPHLLSRATVDLRLSASDAAWGSLHLRDSAASLLVEGGRMDLSLLRATVAGGTVKGRISAAIDLARSDMKAQIGLDRVDAAAALAELSLPAAITGTVQGSAALDAAAGEDANVAGRLGGRVSLTLQDGDINGVDVAEMLKRVRIDPPGPVAWLAGRTPFTKAALRLAVAGGIGDVADGSIDGAGWSASIGGRVSLPARSISIRVPTTTLAEGAGADRAPPLVFGADGPWSAPQLSASVGPVRETAASRTAIPRPTIAPAR